MAGTNLNAVVSSIQGVSTLWIMEHSKLPQTPDPLKLEDIPYPDLSSLSSGAFDCVGRFGEGTFSQEGEDASVEDKKYTDGTVAFSTVKRGTYGIKGELHNVNDLICKNILKMKEVEAGTSGTIGGTKGLVFDKDSGWIDNAVVYIEFDQSNAYKGLLIPNTSVASKFLFKGDSTDNMTIEMNMNFAEAPEKIKIGGSDVAFTDDYVGASWVLIQE